MRQTKKKAGTYSLIKGVLKETQISTLYKALNKDTNELWHAKIFNGGVIDKYQLQESLGFLQETLDDAKDKQYIICVNQIFIKNNSTFIIQQAYDTTLVQLVKEQLPLFTNTIEQILKDIVRGLLELYSLQSFTRSLRPEHIVCVDDVWKIESVVYNAKLCAVNSQIVWNRRFASPQEKSREGDIDQSMVDEQLVWQIGILGLYMILGQKFDYENISSDSDIDWKYIRQNSSQSLYQMLTQCLKVRFDERIRIRGLLDLDIFSDLIQLKSHQFLSFSKFYDKPKAPQISISKQVNKLSPEDQELFRSFKADIERYRYFAEVNKYTQWLPYRNQFDINFIIYLSYRICLDNLKKIKQNALNWPKLCADIKHYGPYSQMINSLNMEINSAEKYKIQYCKYVEGTGVVKSEVNEIRNMLDTEVVDSELDTKKIQSLYMKMSGSIYTLLATECNKKLDQARQRYICYFSMGAYLINYLKKQDLVSAVAYQKNGGMSAAKFIEQAPIDETVNVTQQLIKKYFLVNTKSSI